MVADILSLNELPTKYLPAKHSNLPADHGDASHELGQRSSIDHAFLRLAEVGRLDPVDDDGIESLAIVLKEKQMIAILEEFGTKQEAEVQFRKGIKDLFAVRRLAGVGRAGKHGKKLDVVFDGTRVDVSQKQAHAFVLGTAWVSFPTFRL